MSDDNGWKIQLSLKIGQHMLNVRAGTWDEFQTLMETTNKNATGIMDVIGTFSPAPTLEETFPAIAQAATQVQAPGGNPGELQGIVEKVDLVNGVSGPKSKSPGKPYKKYTVTISGLTGSTFSKKMGTFDALVGQAAEGLLGKPVFYVAVMSPYGLDLKGLRPAGELA